MLILILVVFIALGVLGLVVGYSAVISIKGEIRDYRQRKESREAQRRASTPRA
jgi:predicted PurR-regulated permease PerM